MAEVVVFPAGGYRYLKAVFQYSSGVAAEAGFAIERARLVRPVALADGFALVERHLAALGRPTTAFCACELRSPRPFTDAGFVAFNRDYVKTLERWGLYRDEVNPVARTNVCPEVEPPAEPVLHAFSYTVPARGAARPSFVVAGSGETREGTGPYRDRVVAFGDVSPAGMRAKIRHVMDEMERRLEALGFGWTDALATNAYSVQDLGPHLADEFVRRGAAREGLTWHYSRPPVDGLEFEMDVRAPARELAI